MVNVRQFDVDVLLNFKSNVDNLKQINNVGVKNSKEILSISDAVTNSLTNQNKQQMLIEQSKKKEADLLLKQIDLENKKAKQQEIANQKAIIAQEKEEAKRNKEFIRNQKLIEQTRQRAIEESAMIPIATKMGITTEQLSSAFQKNGLIVEKNGRIFDKQQLKYLSTIKAQKKIMKSTKQMDFNFLSLIFGGMALQRTFGGFTKAVIGSYRTIGDKNSEFNIGVNKLSGAFTYLKFTIGKAFAENPLVNKTINGLIDGLTSIANFFEKYPNLGLALAALTGGLTGLGLGMQVIGNITTLKMAFAPAVTNATASGLLSSATGLPSWLKIGGTMITLALVGVVLNAIIEDFIVNNDLKDDNKKWLGDAGKFLVTAGLFLAPVTGGWSLIATGVGFILQLASLDFEKVGSFIDSGKQKLVDYISDISNGALSYDMDNSLIELYIAKFALKIFTWSLDGLENVLPNLASKIKNFLFPNEIDLSEEKNVFTSFFKDTSDIIKQNTLGVSVNDYVSDPIVEKFTNLKTNVNKFGDLFGSGSVIDTAISNTKIPNTLVTSLEEPFNEIIDRMDKKFTTFINKVNTTQTNEGKSIYGLPVTVKN